MKCYLIILFICAILGCSKVGKNAGVEGRIVNPLTNEGIPNVSVEFVVKEQFSIPGGFRKIKETTTDENGYFEIHALRVLKAVYVQAQTDQNYYKIGWNQDGEMITDGFRVRVDKGRTMHADFHAVPYGKYRIVINNVNCQGPNDTIIVNEQNQLNTLLNIDWILLGCEGYTTAFQDTPMGNRFINWKVIRGGIQTEFSDTVFINPNVENEFVLNY